MDERQSRQQGGKTLTGLTTLTESQAATKEKILAAVSYAIDRIAVRPFEGAELTIQPPSRQQKLRWALRITDHRLDEF